MTPEEIDDVRKAWEADPESIPIGGDAEWRETALELAASIGDASTAAADIERGLHRRLMKRGAWIRQEAQWWFACIARVSGYPPEVVKAARSPVSCMARTLVVLAKEAGNGG